MLDLRRLRMLQEVGARGTIAEAARALGYTPSAVSQHLAALQQEVGLELLAREGRGVRLTDAALRLAQRTEDILGELERAEAELLSYSRQVRGCVRLAAFPTAAATLVPDAVAAFTRAHSDVEIRFSELEPEDALRAVNLREIDVALVHTYDLSSPQPPGRVETEELFVEDIRVAVRQGYAARGKAIPLQALKDEPWIAAHPETSCERLTVTACELAGFRPNIVARANDFRVVLEFVSAGVGVALVPQLAVDGLEGLVAVLPVEPRLQRTIRAATRPGGSRHPAFAAMLAALHDAAALRRGSVNVA
jgi:DNA-binding transcriptional LysR family regulator